MVIMQERVALPGPHPTHLSAPDMHLMYYMHGTVHLLFLQLWSRSLWLLLYNPVLSEYTLGLNYRIRQKHNTSKAMTILFL